jgi:hypothetical protein
LLPKKEDFKMIDIPRHENFSKNADKCGDAMPCVVCGKPCPTSPFSVHVHGGGSDLVTEEEAKNLDDAGDLGWYPIGRNCLKQHPELKEYTVRA